MPDAPAADVAATRARLLARRDTFAEAAAAAGEARRPVELDQSRVGRLSRMDAMQGQAMALEVERRRALEVRRIDAALARLDAGEYGYCASCGEDVEAKRLELDPATPLCLACAWGAGA